MVSKIIHLRGSVWLIQSQALCIESAANHLDARHRQNIRCLTVRAIILLSRCSIGVFDIMYHTIGFPEIFLVSHSLGAVPMAVEVN